MKHLYWIIKYLEKDKSFSHPIFLVLFPIAITVSSFLYIHVDTFCHTSASWLNCSSQLSLEPYVESQTTGPGSCLLLDISPRGGFYILPITNLQFVSTFMSLIIFLLLLDYPGLPVAVVDLQTHFPVVIVRDYSTVHPHWGELTSWSVL